MTNRFRTIDPMGDAVSRFSKLTQDKYKDAFNSIADINRSFEKIAPVLPSNIGGVDGIVKATLEKADESPTAELIRLQAELERTKMRQSRETAENINEMVELNYKMVESQEKILIAQKGMADEIIISAGSAKISADSSNRFSRIGVWLTVITIILMLLSITATGLSIFWANKTSERQYQILQQYVKESNSEFEKINERHLQSINTNRKDIEKFIKQQSLQIDEIKKMRIQDNDSFKVYEKQMKKMIDKIPSPKSRGVKKVKSVKN